MASKRPPSDTNPSADGSQSNLSIPEPLAKRINFALEFVNTTAHLASSNPSLYQESLSSLLKPCLEFTTPNSATKNDESTINADSSSPRRDDFSLIPVDSPSNCASGKTIGHGQCDRERNHSKMVARSSSPADFIDLSNESSKSLQPIPCRLECSLKSPPDVPRIVSVKVSIPSACIETTRRISKRDVVVPPSSPSSVYSASSSDDDYKPTTSSDTSNARRLLSNSSRMHLRSQRDRLTGLIDYMDNVSSQSSRPSRSSSPSASFASMPAFTRTQSIVQSVFFDDDISDGLPSFDESSGPLISLSEGVIVSEIDSDPFSPEGKCILYIVSHYLRLMK